ncbi:hypothetical protein [Spiroplasma endosymbiont of Polydrusus pterygomalis]|uniref:hypothetical protein n=1 Tax=Spiroplasma endosymbiont of Polydrusus pterygomalis TaxID=3139327 RepID=UPI003CCB0A89
MSESDFFLKETFIEKMQKSYQIKNYNNLLLNFEESNSQFVEFVDWCNNISFNSRNKQDLMIIIKWKKWWYSKKIQLLRVKRNLANKKIRAADRKIYFEILSLYFNNDNLAGKVLYRFEYEKWAATLIKDVKIANSNLKDLIKTLFWDVFRDQTFQRKTGLKVENPKKLSIENFIYETINSENILNLQQELTSLLMNNYTQLEEWYSSLQNNDLQIQKLSQLLEKNEAKLEKLKKAWFFKKLRCKRIKTNTEILRSKIVTKKHDKIIVLQEIENFYAKSLDNLKIKEIKSKLYSKIWEFYLAQKADKNLSFSACKISKTEFMTTYKTLMKNLTHNPCKLILVSKFTEILFNDILTNIERQAKDSIKIVNSNNVVSSLEKNIIDSLLHYNNKLLTCN